MKFQIWFSDELNVGTFTHELDDEEVDAFQDIGFEIKEEGEFQDKGAAEAWFINWCNKQAGSECRVLVGNIQTMLEE